MTKPKREEYLQCLGCLKKIQIDDSRVITTNGHIFHEPCAPEDESALTRMVARYNHWNRRGTGNLNRKENKHG